jgi:hypothetical protein
MGCAVFGHHRCTCREEDPKATVEKLEDRLKKLEARVKKLEGKEES